MKQDKILDLLVEAANPECSETYRNKILNELIEATKFVTPGGSILPRHTIEAIVKNLFKQISNKSPSLFPKFSPFFAFLCGDRTQDEMTAQIDFDLFFQVLSSDS